MTLDDIGHALHLPRFIQRRLCDALDNWILGRAESDFRNGRFSTVGKDDNGED